MFPKTRKEAASLGISRYCTDRPCKYNHFALRATASGVCMECQKFHQKNYRLNNKEIIKQRQRKWLDNNIEQVATVHALWLAKNKDKVIQHQKKRYTSVTKRIEVSTRRAAKLHATPVWANQDAINLFYVNAKIMEQVTGIKYHVDHIIPLKGKNVCGLHVEYNLQVITARENLLKNNRVNL